jgi:hypothetical protein
MFADRYHARTRCARRPRSPTRSRTCSAISSDSRAVERGDTRRLDRPVLVGCNFGRGYGSAARHRAADVAAAHRVATRARQRGLSCVRQNDERRRHQGCRVMSRSSSASQPRSLRCRSARRKGTRGSRGGSAHSDGDCREALDPVPARRTDADRRASRLRDHERNRPAVRLPGRGKKPVRAASRLAPRDSRRSVGFRASREQLLGAASSPDRKAPALGPSLRLGEPFALRVGLGCARSLRMLNWRAVSLSGGYR